MINQKSHLYKCIKQSSSFFHGRSDLLNPPGSGPNYLGGSKNQFKHISIYYVFFMPSLSIANNLSQADNKAKASTLAPLHQAGIESIMHSSQDKVWCGLWPKQFWGILVSHQLISKWAGNFLHLSPSLSNLNSESRYSCRLLTLLAFHTRSYTIVFPRT